MLRFRDNVACCICSMIFQNKGFLINVDISNCLCVTIQTYEMLTKKKYRGYMGITSISNSRMKKTTISLLFIKSSDVTSRIWTDLADIYIQIQGVH